MPDISKYEQQIPKKAAIGKMDIFNVIAGITTIVGLAVTIFLGYNNEKEITKTLVYIQSGLFIFVICILSLYIYFLSKRKMHRYAQAVYYCHYINHIIRDHIASAQRNNFREFNSTLQKIVDAISNCYSLLTGRQCRCSIKELDNDFILKTVIRDQISISRIHENPNTPPRADLHKLQGNTDFYNLWHSVNGCSRYFLCNNLKLKWLRQEYKNTSFELQIEKPKISGLCFWQVVVNWTLPYKSTLVIPIRYFSTFSPPPEKNNIPIDSEKKDNYRDSWHFWGFLCIDCNSNRAFDEEFAPELGAAFADILYTYAEQTDYMLNNSTKKESLSDSSSPKEKATPTINIPKTKRRNKNNSTAKIQKTS